jgi:hypothetical protein
MNISPVQLGKAVLHASVYAPTARRRIDSEARTPCGRNHVNKFVCLWISAAIGQRNDRDQGVAEETKPTKL